MADIGAVQVTNGQSGVWRIDDVVVSEMEAALSRFRGYLSSVEPGTYKRLMRGSSVVMSNTQMEQRTNREFVRMATGRVLMNGLGLGMVLTAVLKKADVTEAWVVEKSEDVIALVSPAFTDPRVKIFHADALEFKPPVGVRFNAVWHDIWDDICEDNEAEMIRLHRKYGRRCDWQGSWARGLWK